jgi:hypothetical protein
MHRLMLVVSVAVALFASTVAASAAPQSHVVSNTGWFCPTLGQTVNAGGGYSYVCWSYRWFLVHREG